MRINVYQIDHERDAHNVGFMDMKWTTEHAGQIDPSIYKTVYEGDVDCRDIEDVFDKFNHDRPPNLFGHSMSVSDVVEVQGGAPDLYGRIKFYNSSTAYETCDYTDKEKFEKDIAEAVDVGRTIDVERLEGKHVPTVENGCYFCDSIGFKRLDDFDSSRCQPLEGHRMLMVEPHKPPYEVTVPDDFRAIQQCVSGTFECVSPFEDEAFLYCNDEAKLNGMEGNRKINGDIIAGVFMIARDDGHGGTADLTDEQVAKYSEQFKADESYTPEEVADSAGMYFIGFN